METEGTFRTPWLVIGVGSKEGLEDTGLLTLKLVAGRGGLTQGIFPEMRPDSLTLGICQNLCLWPFLSHFSLPDGATCSPHLSAARSPLMSVAGILMFKLRIAS